MKSRGRGLSDRLFRGAEGPGLSDGSFRRAEGLLPWIIAFKAFKAVTLTTLGIALLAARHSDPVDLLIRAAFAVHLPLTSRLFERALEILANLTITRQTALAISAFVHGALMASEGTALYL